MNWNLQHQRFVNFSVCLLSMYLYFKGPLNVQLLLCQDSTCHQTSWLFASGHATGLLGRYIPCWNLLKGHKINSIRTDQNFTFKLLNENTFSCQPFDPRATYFQVSKIFLKRFYFDFILPSLKSKVWSFLFSNLIYSSGNILAFPPLLPKNNHLVLLTV